MALKYPSFKNGILIALAVLILTGAFVFSEYRDRLQAEQEARAQGLSLLSSASNTQNPSIDYNGDWEKTLQVAVGSSTWINSPGTSSASTTEKLNTTELFGRNLFTGYMSLKQSGLSSDPDSQAGIAGEIVGGNTFLPDQKMYTTKDIVVISDNSISAMKAYKDNLNEDFKSYLTKGRSASDIVQDSLNHNDPAILKELNPIITRHKSVLKLLLKTPVPSALSSNHLDVINAMSELIFAEEGFTKIYTDGIVALQGAKKYQEGLTFLSSSISLLFQYFHSINII